MDLDLDTRARGLRALDRLHRRPRGGVRACSTPTTLGLAPRFEELRDAAAADPVLADVGRRRADLLGDRDPLGPGRGPRPPRIAPSAIAAGGCSRSRPSRASRSAPPARTRGLTTASSTIIDTEHYHRVEDGLKYVAWRNNTFSLHVHVGVRGADRAVLVCDRLRPVLPLLLAISANSPFLDGRDSGLHSARTQIFTKSFPRCGVPDAFGGWDAFADYIEFLVAHAVDRRVHAGLVVGAAAFRRSAPSRCGSATPRRPRPSPRRWRR